MQTKRDHVEVERFFKDEIVLNNFLLQPPPASLYQRHGLIRLYSERATKLLMNHGEHRLRRAAVKHKHLLQRVQRVHYLADRIFFRVLSVYVLARKRHECKHKGTIPDDDDDDDDDGENESEMDDDDDEEEEEQTEENLSEKTESTKVNGGEIHAISEDARTVARENRRLATLVDFGFDQLKVRLVGDGKFVTTTSERSNVICEVSLKHCIYLHQHFYHLYVQTNTVDEPTVRKTIRASLTTSQAVELLMLCDAVYELLERQKIVVALYRNSSFEFAHCLEYERVVHSLYVTRLQLIGELSTEFNGNERNKDYLLTSEMLTIRERQATMYEKMFTYHNNLSKGAVSADDDNGRPQFSSKRLGALLNMSDTRSEALHALLVDYLDTKHVGPNNTAVNPSYGIRRLLIGFMLRRLLPSTSFNYPQFSDDSGVVGNQGQPLKMSYGRALNAFWRPFIRHCVTLFPSTFVAVIYHYVAKRETGWEITITDILRYMHWVTYDDPLYTVYTQRIVLRYLTFDESTLNAHFTALYDTDCLMFAIFVPNRFDGHQRSQQLQRLLLTRIDPTSDLPSRPFAGMAEAEEEEEAQNANEEEFQPFVYKQFACKFLPSINLNYLTLVETFYDLSVYADTIRYGVSVCVEFLKYYKEQLSVDAMRPADSCNGDDDDEYMITGQPAQQQDEHKPNSKTPDARFVQALQVVMNFLNANCWYFDNQFIHLSNANSLTQQVRKSFIEKMRMYSNELKCIDPALAFEKHVNLEDMIACCYRYTMTGSEKSGKIQKVLGNTRAMHNHSSLNFAFLRYHHRGQQQIIMSNVHINLHELIMPNVMFLLTLDTHQFGVEDSELFPCNVDQRATEFIITAIQLIPQYLRRLLSVDSFSMMLYTSLVHEKKHETLLSSMEHNHQRRTDATDEIMVGSAYAKPPSPPTPPVRREGRGRRRRRQPVDDWNSLIASSLKPTVAKRPKLSVVSTAASSRPSLQEQQQQQPLITAAKNLPSSPSMSVADTPLPVHRNDQFVPFTIDREEFFRLSSNIELQWAHMTYTRLKSFRYFVAAMMQILNRHGGERIFLHENGLRLSVNVLLQRLNPTDRERMKRHRNRFVDSNGEAAVLDSEEEEDKEDKEDRRREAAEPPRITTTAGGSINLSLLLNTNTDASSISQFFGSMLKRSLANDEKNELARDYFKRVRSAAQPPTTTEASTSSSNMPEATPSTPPIRWNFRLENTATPSPISSSRSMHEDLMLMENLKELLFDMFHEPAFLEWVLDAVNSNTIQTNNLLDFSDQCFLALFTGYVYVLRTIERKTTNTTQPATETTNNATTLSQLFWQQGRQELNLLRKLFPSRQVSSANLLNLSNGLCVYIESREKRGELPNNLRGQLSIRKREDICYFLMTVYIFCDCNIAYTLFMMRLLLSVKFPGTWNKSVNVCQGSSNAGKSEFIEAVRGFFNSANGIVDPAEWKGTPNDIRTNFFPLMENLMCQSDEVDMINNRQLKTMISKTAKQCRSFNSQCTQLLHTMAKVFMTVNRKPVLDVSDDGALNRLQVVLPVFHQYQPLVQRESNSAKIQDTSAYNVGYQVMKRRYPIGMHEVSFRRGMYYFVNHYGPYIVNKDETAFLAADLTHSAQLSLFVRGLDRTRLSANTLSSIKSEAYRVEAIFHASSTTLADIPDSVLSELDEHGSHNRSPLYLQRTVARVLDVYDTKMHVNLTNQPLITLLSRFDFHASIDPMVKFDTLYTVKQSPVPIEWSRIERILRNHLHEYYLNEERGESGNDDRDAMSKGDDNNNNNNDDVDNDGGTMLAGVTTSVADTQTPRAHKKIDYVAFYDRFKTRYTNMQYRDAQTNQRVPNKWCLTIKRIE